MNNIIIPFRANLLESGTPPFANISSLSFDGVDDYVNLGTDSSLDIFGGDFTISLWAKWGAQTTNSNGIISFGANADKALIGLGFGTEYGKISFTTRIIPNGTLYDMGSGYDDNLWHNIICTLSGTTRTCYVDGVDITATALSANLSVGSNNDIGVRDRSGQDRFFVGSIDEVCILDRVVTPTEITTLSTSPTVDLTSLNSIAWYRNGDNGSWKSPQWLIPNNDNFAANKVSNYSFELDGVADYIDCGNDSVFNLTNAMTLSAWVKPSSLPLDDFIIAKRWTSNAYQMATNSSYKPSASIWIGGVRYNVFGTTSLSVGTWYNIIITFNGLELKVYLNGSLENTTAAVGNLDQTTDIVSIAKGLNTNSYNFNGNIDEVAIWNTVENPTNIYNGGIPTTISGAIAHYKMGEEATLLTNWTVPDEVGTNDGTSVNMNVFDRIGEAPNSSNNALSLNMDEVDRVTDVPI